MLFAAGKVLVSSMYDAPFPGMVMWSAWVPRAACSVSTTGGVPVTVQSDGSMAPLSKSSQSWTWASAQRLGPKNAARSDERSRVLPGDIERQPPSITVATAAPTSRAAARVI